MVLTKPVISISRRTDIPAFYSPWLKRRLEQEWVEYLHPYSRKVFRLPLGVGEISALVFWSKNFRPFLDILPFLKDRAYPFYCLYTITGLPSTLESKVPPLSVSVETFKKLSLETSPGRVQWRYDPIVFSPCLSFDYHVEKFQWIASRLSGYTRRCIVSFMNRYRKLERRFGGAGVEIRDPSWEEKMGLLRSFVEIGSGYGMELSYCCDDAMSAGGIKKARCVDPAALSMDCGVDVSRMAFSPSRKDCGCLKSFDIGFYDTCPHGCLYCYANSRQEKVEKNWSGHDPEAGALIDAGDSEKAAEGASGSQMGLFDVQGIEGAGAGKFLR